jgi:hypothetical protein
VVMMSMHGGAPDGPIEFLRCKGFGDAHGERAGRGCPDPGRARVGPADAARRRALPVHRREAVLTVPSPRRQAGDWEESGGLALQAAPSRAEFPDLPVTGLRQVLESTAPRSIR